MQTPYTFDPEFDRFSIQDFPSELMEKVQHRTLQAGEYLFQEGDSAEAIYFLESGLIRLVNHTPTGKIIEHYSVMDGEFFAEALMTISVCSCTAIVEKVSQVLVIPKQSWLECLKTHQDLAIAFAGELSNRIHWLKIIIQLRGIKTAKERVWNYLQIIAPASSQIITLDRPLKAIANELDLTPETLSRALKQLTIDNLIKRETQQIILLDS